MKKLLKGCLQGITLSLCIFAIVCLIFDIIGKGTFSLENYQMTKMIIGCFIAGIGFGAPSVVYESEKLSYGVKVLIHMGVGCIVYTIVAFNVGWLGTETTLAVKALIVGCQLLVAFLIWFSFKIYYNKQAKKMNDRIRSMR